MVFYSKIKSKSFSGGNKSGYNCCCPPPPIDAFGYIPIYQTSKGRRKKSGILGGGDRWGGGKSIY